MSFRDSGGARYNALAMRVAVRLFAIARDRAGTSQAWVELPGDATAADALDELGRCFPKLPPVLSRAMVAVNREYVQRDHRLHDGDELAVIPPVSGGAVPSLAELSSFPAPLRKGKGEFPLPSREEPVPSQSRESQRVRPGGSP